MLVKNGCRRETPFVTFLTRWISLSSNESKRRYVQPIGADHTKSTSVIGWQQASPLSGYRSMEISSDCLQRLFERSPVYRHNVQSRRTFTSKRVSRRTTGQLLIFVSTVLFSFHALQSVIECSNATPIFSCGFALPRRHCSEWMNQMSVNVDKWQLKYFNSQSHVKFFLWCCCTILSNRSWL